MYIKNDNSEDYAQHLINEFLQNLFIYIAPYDQNILLSENETESLTPSDVLNIIKEGNYKCRTYLCLLKHNNHNTSNIPLIHMIHGVYNYDNFLIEYLNFMIKMFIEYIEYFGISNASNEFIISRDYKFYNNLEELISIISLRIDGKWYKISFNRKDDKNDEYNYASHFYIVKFVEMLLKITPTIINVTYNPFAYNNKVYEPTKFIYKSKEMSRTEIQQLLEACLYNFDEYCEVLNEIFPKKENTYYATTSNYDILYAIAANRDDIIKPIMTISKDLGIKADGDILGNNICEVKSFRKYSSLDNYCEIYL